MKKYVLILILGSIIILVQQVSLAQNEKFKALFMYNFTKYLEWPASANQGDFIITVIGNSPIVEELNLIAQQKKIGSQNLTVKQVNSPDEIPQSHIVYLPSAQAGLLNQVVDQLSGKHTLIITDKEGSIEKGACINYVLQGGKQRYEISKSHLKSHNLKVATALISMGIPK